MKIIGKIFFFIFAFLLEVRPCSAPEPISPFDPNYNELKKRQDLSKYYDSLHCHKFISQKFPNKKYEIEINISKLKGIKISEFIEFEIYGNSGICKPGCRFHVSRINVEKLIKDENYIHKFNISLDSTVRYYVGAAGYIKTGERKARRNIFLMNKKANFGFNGGKVNYDSLVLVDDPIIDL